MKGVGQNFVKKRRNSVALVAVGIYNPLLTTW